jgi:hypothetical protein
MIKSGIIPFLEKTKKEEKSEGIVLVLRSKRMCTLLLRKTLCQADRLIDAAFGLRELSHFFQAHTLGKP